MEIGVFGRGKTYRPNLFARLFLRTQWRLVIDASRPDAVKLTTEIDVLLPCFDLTSIHTSRGLLWHTIEVRSKTRTHRLEGLTAGGADDLSNRLLDFVNKHLGATIEGDRERLSAVDQAIAAVTSEARQYLAHSDIGAAINRVAGPAANALAHPLFDPARVPPKLAALLPKNLSMLTDPNKRRQYNEDFVVKELAGYDRFFSELAGLSLSLQQREACIRLEDSNLLVASAGSGKTATMVAKVAYVLDKRIHAPEEILVLAFNANAAAELRQRLARQLGVGVGELRCRVTTFHALGLSIIKEVRGKPPQLAEWIENASAEARFLDTLIKAEIEKDEEFRRLWIEMLTLFPTASSGDEIIDAAEDEQRYREARASGAKATLQSLSKKTVRSLQERKIANWLWVHSIDFEYEKQFEYLDENEEAKYLTPDFYYPSIDTYHEHFAINQDGTSPFEGYVDLAVAKRKAMEEAQAKFFETSSAMESQDILLDELENQLTRRGVEPRPRDYAEIAKALEPTVIQRYHNIVSICIKHIRASGLTLEMLLERAKTLRDPNRAKRFAKVIWHITECYSRDLDAAGRIDFDSMIADAVADIELGRYRSPYSLILVDEFQDISESRSKLIKALRYQKQHTKVFAVGDDWQSIYRFSGSDVTIFTEFEKNFGTSWVGRLEQTYRSNQFIAEAAARFVQQNPAQLKKTVHSSRPALPQSIRVVPITIRRDKPDLQNACLTMLSRLNEFAELRSADWQTNEKPKLTVLLLARYNRTIPRIIDDWKFSHIEVKGLTFHRSKGLEADYTLLLDVTEGEYGVPSMIQDDELLHLVVPRPEIFPYAEERRLFYVALTRASRGVFILSSKGNPSRYIGELEKVATGGLRYETVDGVMLQKCKRCETGFMVERRGQNDNKFLGCSRFPSCRETTSTGEVAQLH
ncbi:UvrD-helicase domain-containing protein [Rhizobium rhizosphaerae]|uniref:UvrD-helicase domain-containing protein n=1 Tax=Xaviernesmea rhizosphaerae TaxID=1672749 RepID=UPI001FD8F4B9|nr:UvrD-helicase domain-containing protein [Xaviernesmea rhizosphaerae]